MRKILVREDAFNDLDSSSAHIGKESPRASVRFLNVSQKAFQLIADVPGIGVERDYGNPALEGMRMCPVPRSRNYLIFYIVRQDSIEVVRVLHGSQDIQSMFTANEE